LVATGLAIVTGFAAFAGCSADGGAIDGLEPLSEPEPAHDGGTPLMPGNSSGSTSSGGRSGDGDGDGDGVPKKDGGTGTSDAGKPDPKPTAPQPGEPCSEPNKEVEKECGACGKHSAICLVGDGGATFWSEYSSCSGELPGGCVPGTTVTEPCGNCGTRVLTCSKYCAWSNPVCTGEPANSCPAGSVDIVASGCPAQTYRIIACKSNCTPNPAGACAPPPKVLEVVPTVNSFSATVVLLSLTKTTKAITGTSCPNPTVSSTLNVAYDTIQVHNPLPKAVTVSIWNSGAPPANAVVDTTLVAYNGEELPADRKGCIHSSILSTVALTGDTKFAALTDSKKVTIPAGGTITLYVGGAAATTEGPVKLTVRTDTIAP
jgi:hypothetical protein